MQNVIHFYAFIGSKGRECYEERDKRREVSGDKWKECVEIGGWELFFRI
jgi:hypothetical protein